MDNVLLEIDSIYNDYRMDMFIKEYNNFSNIMNKNNIINEGIKYELEPIINKIKSVIKKLIEKIKEFFKNLYIKLNIKISTHHYKLNKLPDNYVVARDVFSLIYCEDIYEQYKNQKNNLIHTIDQVDQALSTLRPNSTIERMDRINEKIELENEIICDLFNKFIVLSDDEKVDITGADVKQHFDRLIKMQNDTYKESWKIRDILIQKLNKADSYLSNIAHSTEIDNKDFDELAKDYSESYRNIALNFIEFYRNIIKAINMLSRSIVQVRSTYVEILNSLSKIKEVL